ncbi:MAG: hypothetical protein JXR64_06510, partial [Spirochaetales bacterium]|nr:hypothetical protein [Spirochaetales bacterium]
MSQEIDINSLSEKEIIRIIDEKINNRDSSLSDFIYLMGSDFPNYSKYEEYLLDWAYKLISEDDLGFPLTIAETVLSLNLENERAQKLYSIIVDLNIEIDDRIEEEKKRAAIKRDTLEYEQEEINLELLKEEELTRKVTLNSDLASIVDGYTSNYSKVDYITKNYYYPYTQRFYSSEVFDGFVNRESIVNDYSGFGLDCGIGYTLGPFTYKLDFHGNITYEKLFEFETKQAYITTNFSAGLKLIPIYLR